MTISESAVRMRGWVFACIALVSIFLGDIPAAEAQHARKAAELVAALPLPMSMRTPLRAAVTRALNEDSCDDTEFEARLVDLNRDSVPEVHITGSGPCINSMAGGMNWVFIRGQSGEWNPNFEFNGGLIPLRSRSQGFVDVAVAGPGFTTPVWRWNGRTYARYCNVAEGRDARNHTCPPSVNLREAGEDFAAFPTRTAVNICGTEGRFAIFAQRRLATAPARVPLPDRTNLTLGHEQLFFCDGGRVVENLGFTTSHAARLPPDSGGIAGTILIERLDALEQYQVKDPTTYNFELMSRAVGPRTCDASRYSVFFRNCQHWADELRRRYRELSGAGTGTPNRPSPWATVTGEWRVRETMRGNVAAWPERCTAEGVLHLRVENGALVGRYRTERLECRNPSGGFKDGPWENRFQAEFVGSRLSFSQVEGCPYTAALSSTGTELRGTLQCTIGYPDGEPMTVYGEWVATRVSARR